MKYLLLIALLLPINAFGLTKIAIIDTGLDLNYKKEVKLCATGHYDYIAKKAKVGNDLLGHGTNIVLTIKAKLKIKDYCFIILKVFDKEATTTKTEVAAALYHANKIGAKFVNYSMSGEDKWDDEEKALRYVTQRDTMVFVSAGNKSKNFDVKCDEYPMCYKINQLIVVGALTETGTKASYSNRGKIVDVWEIGVSRYYGKSVGTSMAVPRALANQVNAESGEFKLGIY